MKPPADLRRDLANVVPTIDLGRDISSPKFGKKVDKHEAASPIDDPFVFEGHAEATEDFSERFFEKLAIIDVVSLTLAHGRLHHAKNPAFMRTGRTPMPSVCH
jgi:hypothetical protein